MAAALVRQRQDLEQAWQSRFAGGPGSALVRPDVSASWERSARRASTGLTQAPVDESADPARTWRDSPLRPAIEALQDDLRELADDRGFVAAVMDDTGRLLWTTGSRHMRRLAEGVNFAPGGRWDEASVGTNALALALDTGRPAQVFSAEHYAPMVHGWCCFAAPLHDPLTGRALGVLDLSSTWDRAHPLALTTVRALARAAQAVLDASPSAAARVVSLLGRRELRAAGGPPVPLSLRQAEVFALLALAGDGLSPEQLHDRLHASTCALATTKADVSHLRALTGGAITHRRYRLEGLDLDLVALRDALQAGDAVRVAQLYAGPLLPESEAPGIREWREVLAVGVRELALSSGSPALAERLSDDLAVQQAAVAALAPGDPRRGWAQARVQRASS